MIVTLRSHFLKTKADLILFFYLILRYFLLLKPLAQELFILLNFYVCFLYCYQILNPFEVIFMILFVHHQAHNLLVLLQVDYKFYGL